MADLPEKVVLFPGVTELPRPKDAADLPQRTKVKALFKTALALGVHDLVVIGRLPEGDMYIASQSEDQFHVTGMLSKAATWMGLPDDPEYEDWDEEPTG